jgi:hypothetical protein
MDRLVLVALVACLLSCVACGDIFVRGAINPGVQFTSGTVSIVQLNASSGSGVTITIITLMENNAASTLQLCGDQRALFPLSDQVQVSFRPGTTCASVLTVNVVAVMQG